MNLDQPLSGLQGFSRLTDVVSRLLHMLACPYQCRGFVDALIGLGDGDFSTWFEISDQQLGWRIRTDQPGITRLPDGGRRAAAINDMEKILRGYKPRARALTDESVRKAVQRDRKRFSDWQKQVGIELIEIEPGGQAKEKRFCSRYRFPIFYYLEIIQEQAQSKVEYAIEPDLVFEREARTLLLAERLRVENATPRKDRFRRSRSTIQSETKRSLTALRKAMNLCILSDADFPNDVVTGILHELDGLCAEWREWLNKEKVVLKYPRRA